MINKIIENYTRFPQVEAIAIGGSGAAKTNDNNSDIDIYVFKNADIPLEKREAIVRPVSSKFEVGGEYFGSGDEFFVDEIEKQLDVMYWDKNWFENTVNNVWLKHFPSNGYTTCFLYTLKNLIILYDKTDWLKNLQNALNSPYPAQLKQNIIKRNLMLLKDKPFASYYEQIKKALKRNDFVSVNHRLAAFIASYFDIIFAVNEQLHPGEKRLIDFAQKKCKILPEDFKENLEKLINSPTTDTLDRLNKIIDNLRKII